MNFTVSIKHRSLVVAYIIKMERDEIYIAIPQKKKLSAEKIFLTKTADKWVGDNNDKRLIKKLGCQIEAALALRMLH